MNTKQIGHEYERSFVKYLRNRGYLILARNVNFYSEAEIDILASKDNKIYFFEVKKRESAFLQLREIVSYKQVIRQRLVVEKFKSDFIGNMYEILHILCICLPKNKFYFVDIFDGRPYANI